MSKKSILMMLAVFVVGIAAVLFLPKTVQAVEDTYDEYFYLCIDGVGGKVNGKDKILIEQKADEFTTVDLSAYKAVRDGYEFCGWGYYESYANSKIVASIDKSYFSKDNRVTIFALYKAEAYDESAEGNGKYTLILDANGGTIDGEFSKKYNYIGDNSLSMPIFHYVPERKGCKFRGWNSKKDGTGINYKLIDMYGWRRDTEGFDRDMLMDDGMFYKNLTLYAVWEGTPIDDTVKEIEAVDGIKGSITFENEVDAEYKLEIKKMDIPDNLLDDIKYLVDINVLSGHEIVEINGIKMKIKFELPEELKGYDFYEIVYISRNQMIKERIPATVKDGYIYFETTHLSQYGVVAKNNSQETPGGNEEIVTTPDNNGNDTETTTPSASENNTGNPDAGDNTAMYLVLSFAALLGVGTVMFWKKFRVQ